MSIISALPYTLQNGTNADASQVMADFNQIRDDVNNNAGIGSVTSVATGAGLTGGPITTSGTISLSNGTANSIMGYDNAGVFGTVTIGTNLSLSGGVLSATGGGGGVTTFAALTDVTDIHATLIVNGQVKNPDIDNSDILTVFGAGALTSYVQGSGSNTTFGRNSLQQVTTGFNNAAIGNNAGLHVITGTQNTFIGQNTGVDNTSGGHNATNRTAIGSAALALVDNSVQVGNTNITDTYFGDGTCLLHANGSQLSGMDVVISTVMTPTVIDGTQYLALTIGGVTYNVAIVIPGT